MKIILLLFLLLTSSWGQSLKIALMSAPSVIGKYSQSTYNVALSTLMSTHIPFELVMVEMKDESEESMAQALATIHAEKMDAVLAPLTLRGVKNLLKNQTDLMIFIPTVHKRDIGECDSNIVFGGIDYQAQLNALKPYMTNSLAVFYDTSPVGSNLLNATQTLASESKKTAASYAIDTQGANIVKYLSRPAAFSKKSVIIHLPVVKTSMLAAHLTFSGARVHNLLSTQINFDPTLISLTQAKDRKNMIVANSIIEQVPSIYEINALMNNDLTFDWINYTTSVGTDYLIAHLSGSERSYSLRLVDSQIIYPVELMRPKEFGFEPISSK
ncbi:MAG TPA: hypothetical protein VFX68_01570 [Sulfuricurvum sp.]|nr:hypothetical protein [Sulfuricurvum sp.]